jgi:hypothetical protein
MDKNRKNDLNIDFFKENDKEDYNKFLLSRYDSNIYHTIEWKEILEEFLSIKYNNILTT